MGRLSRFARTALLVAAATLAAHAARAQTPAHPNPFAQFDRLVVTHRGDVRRLPAPLKQRLGDLAARPHSVLPVQAFAEVDAPSRLFQYYLLDSKSFQPNVFSA